MRKFIWTIVVMTIFAVGFAASDTTDESLVGKYTLTDAQGTKWYFSFTSDTKVTVKKEGMSDDDMFYGNRSYESDGHYQIDFDDFYAGNPPISFPKIGKPYGDMPWYLTTDGWLYCDYDRLLAKNPEVRLKMNKQ